ncbi:MAG TPA: alpha/beta hydrolase [Solirubrobacterales bacterium]|jgi:pimeloyl-ACP methyl ester carboxylesterase|nr:alpha/beta hydrolase [Solirubrobacterales bacterium]
MSEAHRWRSELLGEPRTLELADATLDYFERGEGPVLLFSHGWLANANLWRKVVDRLHGEFRCLALDLPLGSHRTPMAAGADLSPLGVAGLIATVLERLDLRAATLVGNDSGGAYSQIALANCEAQTAERVSGLVLTTCETPYDEWPPAPFDGLPEAARDPEALGQLLAALEDPAVRAAPVAYGLLLKHPTEASDSYALPASRDPGVLRDVAKAMASATTAPAQAAGEALIAHGELPTLLIWSEEDEVFPLEHAVRYAEELANARLVRIADSYSFTPEDQPEAVATAIRSFVKEDLE